MNDGANEMVFTMGLPAAGKSRMVAKKLAATHEVIDCDLIKASLPGYDPKNPNACHELSNELAERAFFQALSTGGLYVIDSTGTNAEKMVRKMNQAKAMGFSVRLVYVKCSLATSIRRNAARTRTVPESIIRSKALDISTSFEIVATYADSITVVEND